MLKGRNRKQYLNSPEIKTKPRREPSTPTIFKKEIQNPKESTNFDLKKSRKEILHKLNNLFIPDLDYHKYISMLPNLAISDTNFRNKWDSFVDSINEYLSNSTYSRCLTYINEQIDQFREKNEDFYNDYISDHPHGAKKITGLYQSIQNDLNNLFSQINQSGNPLDIISDSSDSFSSFSNTLDSYFSYYDQQSFDRSILEPISNILKCTKSISNLKNEENDFFHFLTTIEDQIPKPKSRIPHSPLQNKNRRNSTNTNKSFSIPSKKTRKSLDYSKSIYIMDQINDFQVKPDGDLMKTENAITIHKLDKDKPRKNSKNSLDSSDVNSLETHMKSDKRYRISSFLFSDSSDETTNVTPKSNKKFSITQNRYDQLNKKFTNSPKKPNKINQKVAYSEIKKTYASPIKKITRINQDDDNLPIKKITKINQQDDNLPIKKITKINQDDDNLPIKRILKVNQDDDNLPIKKITRINQENGATDIKKKWISAKKPNKTNQLDDTPSVKKENNTNENLDDLLNQNDSSDLDRIIISTKKVNNRLNKDEIIIKHNKNNPEVNKSTPKKVPKSPLKTKPITKKKNDNITLIRKEHKLLQDRINNNGSLSDLNTLKSEIDTLQLDLNEIPDSDFLMIDIGMTQDLIDLYRADIHSLEDECEAESRINAGVEAEDETATFDNPGLQRSCEILRLKIQKAELQIKENSFHRNAILKTIENVTQSRKKILHKEIDNEDISNARRLLTVNTQMINDENRKLKLVYNSLKDLPNPLIIKSAVPYLKMKSSNIEKKRLLKNIANLEKNLQNAQRSSEFTSIQNLYFSMRTSVDRIEEEIKSLNASNSKLMKNITLLSRPDPRNKSNGTIKRKSFDKYEQLREQSRELHAKYFEVQKRKTDELSASEKYAIDLQLEDIQDDYTAAMMEIERLGNTTIQEKLHEKRRIKIHGRKEAAKLIDSLYGNSKLNIEAEKAVINLEKEVLAKQQSTKQLVSPLKKKSSDLYIEKMNDEESVIKLTEALFECKKVDDILSLISQNSNDFVAKINTRISIEDQTDSKERGLDKLIRTIHMLIKQNPTFQKKMRIFNLQKEIELLQS